MPTGNRSWSRSTGVKHSVRRASGYYIITGPDGIEAEGETLMCVHCQAHWKVEPGSGKQRGFCMNCYGPTCGREPCETHCIPFEKAIEGMEAKDRFRRSV